LSNFVLQIYANKASMEYQYAYINSWVKLIYFEIPTCNTYKISVCILLFTYTLVFEGHTTNKFRPLELEAPVQDLFVYYTLSNV
jgi:hypothetical protein